MRKLGSIAAALVIATAASSLGMAGAFGSSDREPSKALKDPTADNTDVNASVASEAPGMLNIVANWLPIQNPAGGPYFGKLDPAAHYYVMIDNTGDGVEDVAYRWQFKNRFRNPSSLQSAVSTVNSATDSNLNYIQSYDLYYATYPNGVQRPMIGLGNQGGGQDDVSGIAMGTVQAISGGIPGLTQIAPRAVTPDTL